MAKKKAAKKSTKPAAKRQRDKQQRIPGTIDAAIEAVDTKAEEYVAVLCERRRLQENESTLRDELIELMHKHDVRECHLDGYEVKLVETPAKAKIKCKKLGEDDGEE